MNHPRVVNSKQSRYEVYIGRPSKWGNPFSHLKSEIAQYKVKDRNESIQAFADWIVQQEDILNDIEELEGKVLGCFCDPEPCHGSILALMSDYFYARKESEYEVENTRGKLTTLEFYHLEDNINELINEINISLRQINNFIIIIGSEEFKELTIKIIKHINGNKQEKIFYVLLENDGSNNQIITFDTKNTLRDIN